MNTSCAVTNVVVAGLGGQGVIKASDIIAAAAFEAGRDVKKSEIHGMSQRGGSVTSDVRFGAAVLSPMVPGGEADFLVVVSPDQVENNRHVLRADGVLLEPGMIDGGRLNHSRSLNVALVGALSAFLSLPDSAWQAALEANLPEKARAANDVAFALGRAAGARLAGTTRVSFTPPLTP
jgi:indolepyruvate ferredoxin oxidoreductase beta subunit